MISKFDPNQLGKAEINWWVAHNDRDKVGLYKNLVLQNTLLFGIDAEDAKTSLTHLIEAVKYHDTHDWAPAISATEKYYQVIKEKTGLSFDPKLVAQLEVGWWKLHDELEFVEDKTPLANAFTKLYAAIFGVSESKLVTAGVEKAKATKEHDLAEDPNTLPSDIDGHWKKAEEHLINFYQELQKALT